MKQENVTIAAEMGKAETVRNKVLLHRASIEFTLSFALADVINTLLMDAESDLKKTDKTLCLKRDDKQNFNRLRQFLQMAKTQAAKCAELMYKDAAVSVAVEDSDFIHELLLTFINKSGGEKKTSEMILEKINKSYKSKLPFLIKRDI